ncbi:MAG: serine--tRNA ligase [Alphaproteobacteria bacterium]
MIDKKYILENLDRVKKSAQNKGFIFDSASFQKLDTEISKLKTTHENLLAEKNKLSKSIPTATDKQKIISESKQVGEKAKEIENVLRQEEAVFEDLMLRVPQVHEEGVPIGKDDSGNVVIKTVGEKTEFNFKPKDHYTLLEENDWADFLTTADVCGSRSYTLKGAMARLERAIQDFVLDKLSRNGFTVLSVPSLCKPQNIFDAGHFPGKDLEALKDDVYFLEGTDLCLAGTSEITLNGFHKNQILNEKDLPKFYAGFSPCFRKEAGAAGKDTRGLVRVHQFAKVEQFVFCKKGQSQEIFEKLLGILEETMLDLELPYQLLEACTGDMGFNKIKMTDVEAWVPTQEKYRELGSCSIIGDFQSRRTNTRYRDSQTGKLEFTHTLNNTGIATPRVLVPLMENHQTQDGDIRIPEKLRPYMNDAKTLKGFLS